MSDLYIVGIYGYRHCSLLQLHPYDSTGAAKRAIAWQGVGEAATGHLHICTPHPTERGTFVRKDNGLLLPVQQGPFTAEAWQQAQDRIWGKVDA
jgi:hypothetical protein